MPPDEISESVTIQYGERKKKKFIFSSSSLWGGLFFVKNFQFFTKNKSY